MIKMNENYLYSSNFKANIFYYILYLPNLSGNNPNNTATKKVSNSKEQIGHNATFISVGNYETTQN